MAYLKLFPASASTGLTKPPRKVTIAGYSAKIEIENFLNTSHQYQPTHLIMCV
jgi:hypothetical protein